MTDPKEVADLVAWLEQRAEPDSGILYEQGGTYLDQSRVVLRGTDADFIAKHFHGKGAAQLASALQSLSADLERVTAERDAADRQIEALSAKVDALAPHETCGCSYDSPDHLCLHHSPQLAAAEARISTLTEALTPAELELALRFYRDKANYPIVPANHDEALREAIWSVLSGRRALPPTKQGEDR